MRPEKTRFQFMLTGETKLFYSNAQLVTSTAYDVTIDCAFVHGAFVNPENPQVPSLVQIAMTPAVAKRLWETLGDRLRAHEQSFGPIAMPAIPGTEPGDIIPFQKP